MILKPLPGIPPARASASIGCANVKIELSTDGGNTFPITILANTPNDGSEEIQVPNNITAFARIRISAVGNIFYDISNTNFSIQNSPAPGFCFQYPGSCCNMWQQQRFRGFKNSFLKWIFHHYKFICNRQPGGHYSNIWNNPVSPGSTTTVTLN
jgi:hypothetical protein